MRILLLATDVETRNYYITLAIQDALARNPFVEAVVLARHGDAVALFSDERCDCFLAVGGATHQTALLARLCRMADSSVLWTTEDPYELPQNVEFSKLFDHVFTNDSGSVESYGGRAAALPLAASLLFHDREVLPRDENYKYDLLFVGTAWPNRVTALNRLIAGFGGRLRVKIGLPSNEFLPTPSLPFLDQDIAWRCSNAEFARLANQSRVTLTLERDFTTAIAGRSRAESPPPRLFEAALAGSYQVLLATQAASTYFVAGAEVALCKDEAEMKREIEIALADPALRIGRARAARRHAQAEHLYDHRVAAIVGQVRVRRPSPTAAASRPASPRNVLVVTHNVNGMRPGGGVEAYQEELPRMEGGFAFTFLFPAVNDGDYVFRVRRPDGALFDRVLPAAPHPNVTHDAHCEAVFQRILLEDRIDLVHFQHLIGFPLSLPLIAAASGVPTIWSVHDYYPICKRFNLTDYSGRFCDIASKSKANCDVCLSATDGLAAGAQGRRMAFMSRVLGRIDAFVVSTPYSGRYLREIYPELPVERFRQVEMLMPAATTLPARPPADAASPLRVVIPGNFTEGKGGHQLVRLMNLMRERRVEFTILGYVHPDFANILDTLAIKNLTRRGAYRPLEAVRLLSEFDVSLHLSIWPETYMITLSEAWAAGVVPIVSHLGAPGERVQDEVNGLIVDPLDIGAVVELLDELIADRSRLQHLRDGVLQRTSVSVKQHLAGLRDLYKELIASRPVSHAPVDLAMLSRQPLSTFATGTRTNSPRWDIPDNSWDAQHEPLPVSTTIVTDSIPTRYLRPRQLVAGSAGLAGARATVDLCRADGERVTAEHVLAAREVALDGWAFAPGQGPLMAAFVCLDNGQGATLVRQVDHAERPDVATALHDTIAGSCGFQLTLDLRQLPQGSYSLGLVHTYADAMVTFPDVLWLTVDPTPARGIDHRTEGAA